MRDRRTFSALVGGGLLLVLFWPATSGTPAPPADPPPAPNLERLAMLEELAYWRRGDRASVLFADERPLSALAEGRQRSFALFADQRGNGGRHQLLASIPYGPLIEDAAERYRLDSLLLLAMVQTESGFDAGAISPRGAQGLMQLMPTTAQTYGALRPTDPHSNVRAGARYVRDLLHRFDDDLELALAAYNAGPAAVRRFRGVPPYRETRHYVERVLTLYIGYHRTLWQEAQLDALLGDLPPVPADSTIAMLAPAAFGPRFAVQRRSARLGRTLGAAVVAVTTAQPLAEVADALAQPLAELRQPRVAEDQQHDGEDDQQLRDAKASEHDDLRGGTLRGGARLFENGAAPSGRSVRGFDLGVSLADREAPPPTPAAAPPAAPAAPEPRQTTPKPERESAPPG
jgi:soluble lytic murein transglycosylase-like protein